MLQVKLCKKSNNHLPRLILSMMSWAYYKEWWATKMAKKAHKISYQCCNHKWTQREPTINCWNKFQDILDHLQRDMVNLLQPSQSQNKFLKKLKNLEVISWISESVKTMSMLYTTIFKIRLVKSDHLKISLWDSNMVSLWLLMATLSISIQNHLYTWWWNISPKSSSKNLLQDLENMMLQTCKKSRMQWWANWWVMVMVLQKSILKKCGT